MHAGQVRDHVEQLVAQWLPETAKLVGERTALSERAFEEVG
jgi:hypothetical protein